METKKTGISREFIIHPGETIADILEDRGISQSDLAERTGVTSAYVSQIISGKKGISLRFAMALEYALDVPKSFWLNLQANYEAELLELNEAATITKEEIKAYESLKEIIKYLRKRKMIPVGQTRENTILSLRKTLKISNIANLQHFIPEGAFRISTRVAIDPFVVGAWLRLCQISEKHDSIDARFDSAKIDELARSLKGIMLNKKCDLCTELTQLFRRHGIDFSIVKNFRGAPVQGYISQSKDGIYHLFLTIRGAFADIFWFSLFHELGHIANGDVSPASKYIYIDARDQDSDKESAANRYAGDALIDPSSYERFIKINNFSISAIQKFAETQNIEPYIVIGRLQKEHRIPYEWYSRYKLRYKWPQI